MSALLRLLGWLLAVALVALPVVALVNGWIGGERWPLRTLRLPVELRHVDRAQVRAAVLPHAQRGFFAVRLDAIQAEVSRLPWVEHAEVRKQWPDVLEVRIDEHRPIAHWGGEGLLAESGRVFPAKGLSVPRGLPQLDGPQARATEVMALYEEARTRLPGVRGVTLDKRGSWSIQLGSGTQVVLGRNDPSARLQRFAPLLPRLAAQHPRQKLVRADLRYTNGFSLTWADLPKPPPAPELPRPLAQAGGGGIARALPRRPIPQPATATAAAGLHVEGNA